MTNNLIPLKPEHAIIGAKCYIEDYYDTKFVHVIRRIGEIVFIENDASYVEDRFLIVFQRGLPESNYYSSLWLTLDELFTKPKTKKVYIEIGKNRLLDKGYIPYYETSRAFEHGIPNYSTEDNSTKVYEIEIEVDE